MTRLARAIFVSLFLMAPATCNAEEPYREWMEYFAGKWQANTGNDWSFEFRFTKGKTVLYC